MSRRSATTTKVFVGSLPPGVTTDDLRNLFAPYGAIAECDIANRCGFLHLEDKDLAMKAIEELNNTTFMGGRISVEKGRVKPPNRGRGGGGPMRGGKDRGGPYSRDFRGPPRNGSFGGRGDYPPYGGGDRYGDYDRGLPPRGYDGGYGGMGERRPMYDDRRGGYMGERRPYPNGFDDRPPYQDPQRGYDDRRPPPPGPGGYYDYTTHTNDRRPLVDQQAPGGMGVGIRGPPGPSFDRQAPTNDMFSRRADAGPKPLLSGNGYGNRDPVGGGYGTATAAPGYSTVGQGVTSGYSSTAPAATGYGTGYNDGRTAMTAATGYGAPAGPTAGYGDTRAPSTGTYGGGYSTTQVTGGYGDSYGTAGRTGGYDSAYPPLPQQRSFTSGGPGPGPRRDMPPGRRF